MSYMDQFSLKGKKCVVTGCADPTAIGMAIAEAFADAGGDLIIADAVQGDLEKNAEFLRSKGVQAEWQIVDIANRDDVERFRDFVMKTFDRIDVLMNNAGVFQGCPSEDMEFEEWRRVMSVNLDGNFSMTQIFGREMIKQKSGSIIFTSSKSGITVDVPQKQIAYNTSKAAVDMMAKVFAVEWAPYNIRVNCINPGNITTGRFKRKHKPGSIEHDTWLMLNTSKRFGAPSELGCAAIYLASDASSYVTGQQLSVDGGYNIV